MRSFRRFGATGVVLAGLLLATTAAACGSSSPSSGGAAKLQPVSLALDFIPNADNEGVFVAEKLGYFKDAGINISVIPYGETPPDTLVGAGKVDFAISALTAYSIFDFASGEKVMSVMAVLQHDPNFYGFLASRTDIKTPKNLCGKIYGGFGAPSDTAEIQAMAHDAGGPQACKFTTVTLGSSAYTAVEHARVDFSAFFFSDIIQAEVQEHAKLRWFVAQDWGIPQQYGALILGNDAWMAAHQALTHKTVGALVKAYQYIQKNPVEGAQIEYDLNKGDVNLPVEVAASKAMAKSWLLGPNGQIGVQSPSIWDAFGSFLYNRGVLTNSSGQKLTHDLNWASYVTNKYL